MVHTILLSAFVFVIPVVVWISAYNCGYSEGYKRGLNYGLSLFDHIVQSCDGDEE